MSTPTAKDLLAQADRLMRQRAPEELPVLTDLVIEEIEIHSLSDRMDEVIPTSARPSAIPAQPSSAMAIAIAIAKPTTPPQAAMRVAPAPSSEVSPLVAFAAPVAPRSPPLAELFAGRPRPPQEANAPSAASGGPNTQTALNSVREQFNEQLLAKLEELQHSVFSQVMQKLEIHAAGSLQTHLRQTLEPALIGIAHELAEQVAVDTATQVRQVVSDAVDAEIARLREQFGKKRF